MSRHDSAPAAHAATRRRGLATKLFAVVIVVGSTLTAVAVGIQLLTDYERERRAIGRALEAIEASYGPALSRSVFTFDTDQTRLLLEGIYLLPQVRYVEIQERRGDDYAVLESVGEPVAEEDALSRSVELEHDYDGETRTVGELRIQADLARLRRQVTRRLSVIALSSAAQVFVVAFLILLLVQRLIVRPLRRTAEFVRSIELSEEPGVALTLPGREPSRRGSDELDEIASSINQMKQRLAQTYGELNSAKDRLHAAVEEKNILLRELYHRTKNNMQVIISMLAIKAAGASDNPEIEELVRNTEARIYAMSLVHEKLYESQDLSRVDMREYIEELTVFLTDSLANGTAPRVEIDVPNIALLFDTAIPCGIIVTELVSNAVQYAFSAPGSGTIAVGLRREEAGRMQLTVADDGGGLPEDFDPRADAGMGLKSVYSIAEHQLGGTVQVERGAGVRWLVAFPESLYAERVSHGQ
ncbi:MAG: sensor histidine kinase [Spirochaetaceae bacterium]